MAVKDFPGEPAEGGVLCGKESVHAVGLRYENRTRPISPFGVHVAGFGSKRQLHAPVYASDPENATRAFRARRIDIDLAPPPLPTRRGQEYPSPGDKQGGGSTWGRLSSFLGKCFLNCGARPDSGYGLA